MSVFAPSQKKRQQTQEGHSLKIQLYIILPGMLMCVLLIVCAACEQYPATQEKHPGTAPQITADPSASQLIYLVTFTAPTTYTQAHALLKELGLETGQWECTPRTARAGESVSAAVVLLLTTPPPSQDTPEFYAHTHILIVGYWEALTPQQLAQLRSSPQVASLKAIPLVSC